MMPATIDKSHRAQAWALMVIALSVLMAYGAIWTRGVAGDDLCMCELATANGYWEAVRHWLDNWNGRLSLALAHTGTYRLAWFSDPISAPWYLVHGIVLLGHLAACGVLFKMLVRAGIAPAAALAGVLILAIHPITHQPLLWLAASYGYVFGNLLTLLAVWAYLGFERTGRTRWLILACVLAVIVVLGIEQYLFVFGALAATCLLRSGWRRSSHPWLPFALALGLGIVYLLVHFVMFSGSVERLARATAQVPAATGPSFYWKLAWWFNLHPDASPYGGALRLGRQLLAEHWALAAGVALASAAAAWRMLAVGSWQSTAGPEPAKHRLWLIAAGVAVFFAALLPFLFTGKYGFDSRNVYVGLPGMAIAVAAVLDRLGQLKSIGKFLRLSLAPAVAGFMALSLMIDIGLQAVFAQSWQFHQEATHAIAENGDAIRKAGGVELVGIPANPYKAIAQIDNAWAFPCLVRWTLHDGTLRAWNNLMAPSQRPEPANLHRMEWRSK